MSDPNGQPSSPPRRQWLGLSGKLMLLTLGFGMLAEVLT